jgi:hypothetical protein
LRRRDIGDRFAEVQEREIGFVRVGVEARVQRQRIDVTRAPSVLPVRREPNLIDGVWSLVVEAMRGAEHDIGGDQGATAERREGFGAAAASYADRYDLRASHVRLTQNDRSLLLGQWTFVRTARSQKPQS